jgi:hypothetical protein
LISLASVTVPMKIPMTRRFYGRLLPAVLAAAILLLASCEKPEGPGGKCTIRGQVILRSYDKKFRVLQSVYPAADEKVYIQYGSSQTISDDRTTSPAGIFEFKYLSKGDYNVFIYSDDSTGNSASGMIAVERSVNLSSNSQEADLGRINIYRTLDVDEGQAVITGLVRQVNYSKDFIYAVDTIAGQDLDVYLVYEDDPNYSDRIRTLHDGNFAFPNLIKGSYTVFVYSENTNRSPEKVPVIKNINVDDLQGMFDAGTLYIAKEI